MSSPDPLLYSFGDYTLDPVERALAHGGRYIPVARKTLDILILLVTRHGHIVEKDEILDSVWPDAFVEEGNLARHVSTLRKILEESHEVGCYIETVPRRGYRFSAPVSLKRRNEASNRTAACADRFSDRRFEPIGGAVPLDSALYISRGADIEIVDAIDRQDSIVLVKGARQVGKTSLMARGLQHARDIGARVALTSFEDLGADDLETADALYLALAKSLSVELGVERPGSVWDADDSGIVNLGRFVRHVLQGADTGQIVWGLDEADRLFVTDYGAEVFGLFRSWHNKQSLDPTGPWRKLTLVLAYATEAHLFISDPNRSPFNVGTELGLDDFTLEQIGDLNRRYGSPVSDEIVRFFDLVGGHPYLARKGLHTLANGMSLDHFRRVASTDEGPMGHHLRRLVLMLRKDATMCTAVREMLAGGSCQSPESFYRLRTAGVISGDGYLAPRFRCRLYERYLAEYFA